MTTMPSSSPQSERTPPPEEGPRGERSDLLARVYSQDGQSEQEVSYVDPESGEVLRMRPSEWALREFDRHAAPSADGAAGSAHESGVAGGGAGPGPGPGPGHTLPSAASASASDRPRYRAALVGAGVAIGVGIMVVVYLVVGGLDGVGRPPDPTRSSPASSADAAAVLEVFDQPPLAVRDLPTEILAEFDAIDVQRVFDPSTNGGGYDVLAARKSRDLYCLVVVRSGADYREACGTKRQIQENGLRLTAVVAAPRPVRLLSEAPDAEPDASPDWQVEVHWNRDGTFSIAGAPVGYDG